MVTLHGLVLYTLYFRNATLDTPDKRILAKAKEIAPKYVFDLDANGTQKDADGKLKINCFYFVVTVLREAGYTWIPSNLENNLDTLYKQFFCEKIPPQTGVEEKNLAQQGDILDMGSGSFLGYGHIGIIESLGRITNINEDLMEEFRANMRPIEVVDRASSGQIPLWNVELFSAVPEGNPQGLPLYDFGRKNAIFANTLYENTRYMRPLWRCDIPRPVFSTRSQPEDPLVLDLDGNGFQTIGLEQRIRFDYDSNGFIENTAWIAPGNGILMLDNNGNGVLDAGRELFSDLMILPSGLRAANGFEALAYYDTNGDGKIDEHDPVWSQLKIWQDNTYVVEGYIGDPDLTGRIDTLDTLGINSIYLDSEIVNATDRSGNTMVRSGHFEWSDHRVGDIGEYSFQRNTGNTLASQYLDVPVDIDALPDLPQYGNLPDLHQWMLKDTSGRLRSLLEEFGDEENPFNRSSVLAQVISEWTELNVIDPGTLNPFISPRMNTSKLKVLEIIYGEPIIVNFGLSTTDSGLLMGWNEAYRNIFEMFYSSLMSDTHLKEQYDQVPGVFSCQQIDFSALIASLQKNLITSPEQGKELLSEFARTLRGLGHDRASCLPCREIFIQQDPSLGWVIDTGGLPVYDHLGQSPDGWYSAHMFGTWGSDAVKGSPTQGDGYINGLDGDDVIYGTNRDEILINGNGNALLVGGGGNDTVYAGPDDDILDGGEGRDTLYGGTGNDTYIFRRGSGQDRIIDVDSTAGNSDTLWLGSNLTPADVTLKRSGNDLVLKINDTSDTMTVQDFFRNDGTLNRIEQIQFMDGTVWTDTDMISIAYSPSDAGETIFGGSGADTIDALGGREQAS